jgi:hypothetical protein
MDTTTKKKYDVKKEFPRNTPQNLIIVDIIARTDESGIVNKVILTQKDGNKITWTPEIEKLDNSGLMPVLMTVRENIKVIDLPQIFHNIAQLVKNKHVVTLNTSFSEVVTYKSDNVTVERRNAFLCSQDVKTMELIK